MMNELYKKIIDIDMLLSPRDFISEALKRTCDSMGYSFGAVAEFDGMRFKNIICAYNVPDSFDCGSILPGCSPEKFESIIRSPEIFFVNCGEKSKGACVSCENPVKYDVKKAVFVPLSIHSEKSVLCVFYDTNRETCSEAEKNTLEHAGAAISVSIKGNRYLDELNKKTGELEREIIDRKKAEAELLSEKERLSIMLRSIGDGVIAVDTAMNVTLMNRAAELITGWNFAETAGYGLDEIFNVIDASTRQKCENPVEKTFKTRQTVGLPHNSIIIHKDGGDRFLSATSAPLFAGDGRNIGAILVFRDITDRKTMEEELLKVSKLESIGILAGGIAHDFNNLLTGIIGNISFAKMLVNSHEKIFEVLTRAEDVAFQAKDLTSQFRTFSKGGVPVKKAAIISELIKNSAEFATRGSHAKCSFDLPDDLWPAEVDEGQFNQAITNLIFNAMEAMPDGGIINISAANFVQENGSPLRMLPGRYIKITVIDSGAGIPAENMARIFDPYFTTKQKGSGLGLTTTYSIIRKHDGLITVESEPGRGSSFTVYFPALSNHAGERDVTAPGRRKLSSKCKILVLDDEGTVREVTSQLLTHLGYDVQTVKDGTEAISVYLTARKSMEPFDALILDLVIPGGIGGAEVIQKLREIDPSVKSIASSGYSNDFVMAKYMHYGFNGVISKPYRIKELDDMLQKIITGQK